MPHNKFKELPFSALVDLHVETTKLLMALTEIGTEEELTAIKKQLELIHIALVEKKTEQRGSDSRLN